MIMVECPGCLQNDLSVTGLSQHLAKTKDARCNAILTASRSNLGISSSPRHDGMDTQDLKDGLLQPENEEPLTPLDDTSSDEEDAAEEYEWEPAVQENDSAIPSIELDDPMDNNDSSGADRESRQHAERQIFEQDRVTIVPYPDSRAGKPITCAEVQDANTTYGSSIGNAENPYSPFSSQMDWEIAQWATLCDPSSTAFSDLLSIRVVCDLFEVTDLDVTDLCLQVSKHLDLSYKNSRELNVIIDKQLPGRPMFRHEQIIVAGEAFDIYYRDVLECIKALYGDPDFADNLVFALERHYTNDNEMVRLYSDMHTGKWWWNTQVRILCCITCLSTNPDMNRKSLTSSSQVQPSYLSSSRLTKLK